MGRPYDSDFDGGRADQLLFALFSAGGFFGPVGALTGSVLAGAADEWRCHMAERHRGTAPTHGSGLSPTVRALLRGLLIGGLAFGFVWAAAEWESIARGEVRGTLAALVATGVPLWLEMKGTRRSRLPEHESGARTVDDVRRARRIGFWESWRREVWDTWIPGYYLVCSTALCSVALGVALRGQSEFGLYAALVFFGARPLVWLTRYLAARRAAKRA